MVSHLYVILFIIVIRATSSCLQNIFKWMLWIMNTRVCFYVPCGYTIYSCSPVKWSLYITFLHTVLFYIWNRILCILSALNNSMKNEVFVLFRYKWLIIIIAELNDIFVKRCIHLTWFEFMKALMIYYDFRNPVMCQLMYANLKSLTGIKYYSDMREKG